LLCSSFLPFFFPSHCIQSHQIMKMLDYAEQNNISDVVSWSNKDGRRFAIHDKKAFKSKILPRYFNDIKFTSFTKQMRRWGFVAYQGARRNIMSFSHPMFIRGDRERCKRMRITQHQQQQQQKSSRARKDNRIISSRGGEGGCPGGAMTTTNQHVSASQHHAPDDSEKEQARFLTTEDAARLCASSKKITNAPPSTTRETAPAGIFIFCSSISILVFVVIGCIFPPPRKFRYHLVSSPQSCGRTTTSEPASNKGP
jgi:hypothetical protein